MTRENALEAWKAAQENLQDAEEAETAALKTLVETDKRHRGEYPLDQPTKEAIYDAFKHGDPLCCEKGREVLKKIGLDECWLKHLNEWAHEYIGCCAAFYKPGGSYYEEALQIVRKKLELEE